MGFKTFLVFCIFINGILKARAWCHSDADCGEGFSCFNLICQKVQVIKHNNSNVGVGEPRKLLDVEMELKANGWCFCCLLHKYKCGCNCGTTRPPEPTVPTTTPTSTLSTTPTSAVSTTPTSTVSTTQVSTVTSTPSTSQVTSQTTTPVSTVTSTPSTSGITTPTTTLSTTPVTTPTRTPTSTPSSTPTTDKCIHFFYDLVILVDESSSIEQSGYDQSMEFVNSVVRNLPVGRDQVNVAVVTFSYNATCVVQFDHEQSEAAIAARLAAETYDDSWTNIHDALVKSIELFQNRTRCVSRALILLTDGVQQIYGGPNNYHPACSDGGVYGPPDTPLNCPPDPARPAEILRNTYSVNIFGVPVGMPDLSELERIVEHPARMFPVENYTRLVEGVTKLIRMICEEMDEVTCPPPTPCVEEPMLDVIWVVDVSGSIDPTAFAAAKQVMADFYGSSSPISPSAWGNSKSRSAWVLFSGNAELRHDFLTTDHSAQNYLDTILPAIIHPSPGGPCLSEDAPDCPRTDIEDGLLEALSLLAQQGRCGVPQVVVVLTDGHHNEGHAQPLDAVIAMQRLNDLGDLQVTTLVIGVNSDPNDSVSRGAQIAIVAYPHNVFHHSDLSEFYESVNNTAIHACDAKDVPCNKTEPEKPKKCDAVSFAARYLNVSFYGDKKWCKTVSNSLDCNLQYGDYYVIDAGGSQNQTDGERGLCDGADEACTYVYFERGERQEPQPCDRGKIIIRCEEDGNVSFYYNGQIFREADGYFRVSCRVR